MSDESFATPFELWCESRGLDPEQLGAWELYVRESQDRERPPDQPGNSGAS